MTRSGAAAGIYDKVKARDPDQTEFLQAVEEVLTTIEPVLKKRPELVPIVEKLCEPERQIMFRVPWCATLRPRMALRKRELTIDRAP